MDLIHEGILPVNKPPGKTSFSLVHVLRKKTGVKKIGHCGTLDPFARGVMILLIGKTFTKQADQFVQQDKEYEALLHLGASTTTYDPEGTIVQTSYLIPSLTDVEEALTHFQGTISQIPPMFSAKKIKGKPLYLLARQGIEVERRRVQITLTTTLISYTYPELRLHITCSKGTYIRSIAHDLGEMMGCHAHLKELTRTRCGPYKLEECFEGAILYNP